LHALEARSLGEAVGPDPIRPAARRDPA
jgi:hypothetical protein